MIDGHMMQIAIIDTLGLVYDGSTLEKRGLGGSESAVISIARELQKLGCNVSVFNNCEVPGNYEGVYYQHLSSLYEYSDFDVVISSRSVNPFIDSSVKYLQGNPHKVLWLHDTFCTGDELIETLVQSGHINEIFTLTDWHTSYITNCDHGRRRNFDVLKRYVFQTRNGINRWNDWVDIKKKDLNHFVFNASVTKGMIPLVTKIWPQVKARCPDARLTVIGGYYNMGTPDQQEQDWNRLVAETDESLDITFTGVITQKQISDILTDASYLIYPCAFPETFGISTLEAIAHNVTPITCNFGALEETAFDLCSWKINYPVEKNWALPWLEEDEQCKKFADLVVSAYYNSYLQQQKAYACNQVKYVCGWDTVALQWKQHLYKVTGRYLPVSEYRKAQRINHKVHRVFGRRFANLEEFAEPKMPENKIKLLVPAYNAKDYIENCILSVAAQDYDNYEMVIVDDASDDNTYEYAWQVISTLPAEIQHKFLVCDNHENRGAVYNQYTYSEYPTGISPNDIIMFLDGDDSLVNDPNIFNKYNNLYHNGAQFTYGSCWSLADNIPLIAQEYPPHVKEQRSYRDYRFNWNMPYTHLRTCSGELMGRITSEELQDERGDFYRAGGDGALFYALIEKADPERIIAVPEVVYNYNDKNPLNDYKVNSPEQTANAEKILNNKNEKEVPNKKILIAIPTARYIESETFKSIYDLVVPTGYEVDFQFFYGYRVDQVRNLIADWVIKGYDYLLAVDHDIILPSDSLRKMLAYDVPLVSGLYRQRLEPQTLEIYDLNYNHWDISSSVTLTEIGACGFGCVLVKKEVFEKVGYPQFEYHPALSHNDTFSEDVDFCKKARNAGFKLYADPSIICGHIGQKVFTVAPTDPNSVQNRLRELASQDLLPRDHKDYLYSWKDEKPKVVYDIGSCVMHWTRHAQAAFSEAQVISFEAMEEVKFLYDEKGLPLVYGYVLGNEDDRQVDFYQNLEHPGGNSLYKENRQLSPRAEELFPETCKVSKTMMTLDTLVERFGLPKPNLIKMDVQGSEMNVLLGAEKTLESVDHLILELQHVDYNVGAPKADEVISYLYAIGFELVEKFSGSELGVDGDYHFIRTRPHL